MTCKRERCDVKGGRRGLEYTASKEMCRTSYISIYAYSSCNSYRLFLHLSTFPVSKENNSLRRTTPTPRFGQQDHQKMVSGGQRWALLSPVSDRYQAIAASLARLVCLPIYLLMYHTCSAVVRPRMCCMCVPAGNQGNKRDRRCVPTIALGIHLSPPTCVTTMSGRAEFDIDLLISSFTHPYDITYRLSHPCSISP